MRRCLPILAAIVVAACASDEGGVIEPPPPEPTVLDAGVAVPVSGTVGDQVPVIVTVFSTPSRTPVRNTTVSFTVVSGGGTVSSATATTDSTGRAQVTWTLGSTPGENVLTATREDKTLRFTVLAQTGNPARVIVQSGDAQTAQVTTQLPQAISVRVNDRLGNPRSGATVTFQTNDGVVIPATAVTNASGIATTNWVLGTRAGAQQLTARADTATAIVRATGTAGPAISGRIVAPTNIVAGDSARLQFLTTDQFGNETGSRPTVWSVNSADLATVTANGDLRGNIAGTFQVTAQADAARATADVTVLPFRYSRVDAGSTHTCAIATDARLYCWGDNAQGALGTGNTTSRSIPTLVAGTRTYTRVAAGIDFTCAIANDQRIYCWGANAAGELGNGTVSTTPATSPTLAAAVDNFIEVSTGRTGACGLASSGRTVCWGGGATAVSDVAGGNVFTQIAGAPAGGHACGINTEGFVFCWGDNNWGQLGNNATANSAAPVQVFGLRFVSIVVGDEHSCGIGVDGRAYCWGRAANGVLGVALTAPPVPFDTCTGGSCYKLPQPVPSTVDFRSITAAFATNCALTDSGEVWCWGLDAGHIGSELEKLDCNGADCETTPNRVVTGIRFSAVTLGRRHSCGIATAGDVWCWGNNDLGQLGRNTTSTTVQVTPVQSFAPRR